MKKLISAGAVCAVAVGLVVVPGALAGTPKSAKTVLGTATVTEAPNPVAPGANTAITGNVASNSNCRRFRNVTVSWSPPPTPPVAPVTVQTNPNGDYSATLPAPTIAGNYTVSVTVAQAFRKVAGKHRKNKKPRSRQFNCVQIGPLSSSTVTVGT